MESMQGKRVLFIGPRFFGYELDIANAFRRRGAEVDMLADRPFESPLMKAAARFGRRLILGAVDRFYRRELEKLGRSSYDLVFVINGMTLSHAILTEIHRSFPRARFVLYMWDSFGNRSSAVANLKFFDECFSFDPDGAREYGLGFRPLFFAEDPDQPRTGAFEHHLSFIGTCHSDRYAIVSSVKRTLKPGLGFYRYLYLQAPWVFHVYRWTNPAFRQAKIADFHFDALPRQVVQEVFRKSRAILDIEHPKQTGLTIRTIQTLGASRKLVTTNGRVREYDFFDPANVCVIDRKAAKIPDGFLETPYRPVDPSVLRKYSLDGWLGEILDGRRGSAGPR
jgi:hypothetical protein